MTENRTPGHYVRQERIRKFGNKQVDAAKAAGLSQPYLSQIERGTRPLTGNAAIKFEQGWGLKPYTLVRWIPLEPASLGGADNSANPGWLTLRPTIRASANLLTFPAFPPPPKVAAA